MKTRPFCVTAVIIAVAVFVGPVLAQNATSKYLISAKAGGVNEIVGDVTVDRSGRVGRLFKGDEVQIGERVSTGIDGKVEILMNPGSYIRLGAKSSFEFESTDLNDVRIKVHSGSAIFEVFGAEDFKVGLNAGNSNFTLLQTGIYRLDVPANGNASLSVWKGKASSDSENDKSAKAGRRVEFAGNQYLVAKFDRDEKDELTLWSGERAKVLSRVSASLRPDRLRDPLINSFWGGHWNLYRSFGLWVYDPFFRSYCFLPFGTGWYSPYGYGFGRPLWYYNLPGVIYTQPPPPGSGNARVPVEPSPPSRRGDPSKGDSDRSNGKVRNDDVRDIKVREPSRPTVEPRISIPRMDPPIIVSEPRMPSPPINSGKKP